MPTWFYTYDMPYYLANARQYVDGEYNGLFFVNPYDYADSSPAIYFQPVTYLFGVLLNLDWVNPGLAFAVFGILMSLAGFYVLQYLLDEYYKIDGILRIYLLCLTAWGGGILVISSIVYSFLRLPGIELFLFEPSEGWWGMNLGRNFILPTEAFYHVIVLLIYFSILRKYHYTTLILTLLLAISHPFTGIQYSLITLVWICIERFIVHDKGINRLKIALYTTPLLFCIMYYLVYLPSFPSHQVIMNQWQLNWKVPWETMLGAYTPVALLALIAMTGNKSGTTFLQNPFNRFLLVCILINITLVNHELFVSKPIQPAHFTHGHLWTPLFLLSLPLIVKTVNIIKDKKNNITAILAAGLFGTIFLSDNFFWIYKQYSEPYKEHMLTVDQTEIINYLNTRTDNPVVISNDFNFGYLSTAYTSVSPYFGHKFNTPFAKKKFEELSRQFKTGNETRSLQDTSYILVALEFGNMSFKDERFEKIFGAGNYNVYRRKTL